MISATEARKNFMILTWQPDKILVFSKY